MMLAVGLMNRARLESDLVEQQLLAAATLGATRKGLA